MAMRNCSLRRWGHGLVILLLTGCSAGPFSPFSPPPEKNQLLSSAKALRQAAPEPLPLPRELDKHPLPAYVVEPGDVLLVQPADLDSPIRLPGDQPVLPDGTIQLGRYGRLLVAGKTIEEIEGLVRELVRAQTKDAGPITVRLVGRVSKVYYVLGEVNAPGAYPLTGRETVLDGLLAAGGLTDRAASRNILLSRPTPPQGCRVVLPICYREVVQTGDTATNYQLASGDRIFVPARNWLEQLLPCPEKDCPPCGAPQVPCTAGPASDPEHLPYIHPERTPSGTPTASLAPVPNQP
jgi:protein involved in polysaccharide export with SLBB domain